MPTWQLLAPDDDPPHAAGPYLQHTENRFQLEPTVLGETDDCRDEVMSHEPLRATPMGDTGRDGRRWGRLRGGGGAGSEAPTDQGARQRWKASVFGFATIHHGPTPPSLLTPGAHLPSTTFRCGGEGTGAIAMASFQRRWPLKNTPSPRGAEESRADPGRWPGHKPREWYPGKAGIHSEARSPPGNKPQVTHRKAECILLEKCSIY